MGGTPQISAIDRLIEEINSLPREQLAARWIKIYGQPPPKGVKRGLLERAYVYHVQSHKLGRLKPAMKRKLLQVSGSEAEPKEAAHKPELRSGAKLLREWNGVTHQVMVTDSGFNWNNQSFGSLSAVARAITGARWSGPRFFGL